jgi:hypothetical protein
MRPAKFNRRARSRHDDPRGSVSADCGEPDSIKVDHQRLCEPIDAPRKPQGSRCLELLLQLGKVVFFGRLLLRCRGQLRSRQAENGECD